LTLTTGFLLIQRSHDEIQVEFRGAADFASVKAKFRVEDFQNRLAALADSERVAMTV
jgi:hypothetical protein